LRVLVLSDIHGNIDALEACLEAAGEIDHVLHLGDCVGYGAAPNQVIERLRALNATHVRGNHDRVIAGGEGITGFNRVAAEAARWTRSQLTQENMAWLAALPKGPQLCDKSHGAALICHGSPLDEDGYIANETTARRIFAAVADRVIFFGHTHQRAGYALGGEQLIDIIITRGRRSAMASHEIRFGAGMRYLSNPGSVGQPRDGDFRAGCLVYQVGRPSRLTWLRVPYDVVGARERILDAGLPHVLGDRLIEGR